MKQTNDRTQVVAAHVWNSLSSAVAMSTSLLSFKQNLKTELFTRSYPDLYNLHHLTVVLRVIITFICVETLKLITIRLVIAISFYIALHVSYVLQFGETALAVLTSAIRIVVCRFHTTLYQSWVSVGLQVSYHFVLVMGQCWFFKSVLVYGIFRVFFKSVRFSFIGI